MGDYELLDFGRAIKALKNGLKVAREGWNGKDMWLALVSNAGVVTVCEELFEVSSHIGMKTAQDTFIPWLASQSDILSEDWFIVE